MSNAFFTMWDVVLGRFPIVSDDTMQQSGFRVRVLVHRKQGRELDGVGV